VILGYNSIMEESALRIFENGVLRVIFGYIRKEEER
jgi:hypothetical protein